MFRRARLSVKPNVRPGIGARGSTAPNPQRGQDSPRPPEPAADSASKPTGPIDVPTVDLGRAESQEKPPRSSDEKTGDEKDVQESNKSSHKRKQMPSTSSLVKPSVSVPSESHPLSTVNQETPQPNPSPTEEKQPCSDRYRIYKAQKLREMLKEELRKEKKQWKNKYAVSESQKLRDHSKMTMRDLIYYLPDNNPMTSSLEQEKKMEKSLPSVQTREQEGTSTPDAEDDEELEEDTDDGPLLVPRVKVAEDGSIILDEESLTVEVLRTKGPCVVEENDPIFERGSTTTYSSFRKNYYSKPWSNKETDMFFLAISMVGTDFSMIGQLFPHRARIEIKNKFKREEKTNGWRIDKAFQEKRPFDFDFFAHLLQKVLAEEEKRKQKSTKHHNLKEKKSSKPRKNVKVKKVACEEVNTDPDESVSAMISDSERSPKDTQPAEEEESLTITGQDLEQVALNQKKRRRKNQEEANNQEINNAVGNATVHSSPSEGEKDQTKCQSLTPEVNEDDCNKKQKLSCVQNTDDIASLASDEKVEKITDPILSSSNQQGAILVATESSELNTSDLPSLELGIILCKVNNADSSPEERNIDLKNTSLEPVQTENVKPVLRGRLQRPKPNLSRAIGKKSVLSKGKSDSVSKNSHPEASVDKNHMEKDKMNTSDISGMENTERENPEAKTSSNLSEKNYLQEDHQPKALRSARVMRGRLQRLKPNVGKAAEKKEIFASQEKIEANVDKNENESCTNRDISQQMEDQLCKNFEREDVTSQPAKKDSFQGVQLEEPKVLNECINIQEDNKGPLPKQVPIRRPRFQKPKPNIGRGTGRREISSKEVVSEEILVSGEGTAALRETVRLDTSLKQAVLVEINTAKEMESDLKETERSDVSPGEKIPEVIDVIMEVETGLKATGRNVSPREKISKVIEATEEIDTDLEETGKRNISSQENGPEEAKILCGMETDLKETRREMPIRETIPEQIGITAERETDLEETGRREITTWVKAPEELKTIGEMEADFKEIQGKIAQREKVIVEVSAIEEGEIDLKETGKKEISLMEKPSERMTVIEEIEADLEETRREISLRERGSEEICVTKEMVADLEKTGKIDISPRENEPEEAGTSRQTEPNLMLSSSGDCSSMPSLDVKNISSEVLSVMRASVEEKRNSEKDLPSHFKTSSQTSEFDKTEDLLMQPPDVPEQFSDVNLSKSLPQEQKPLEVKIAPFVRSRFKRPRPNLARAASKGETVAAKKYICGKKSETDKMETVMHQNSEPTSTFPSQHDEASLMAPGEDGTSGQVEEETVILPCTQTEKDLSPSNACEPKEKSLLTKAKKDDLVISTGSHNINTFQEEVKKSVIQSPQPIRGRLQRPRPNVRRAGLRQIVAKGETKGIIKEERTVLQKDAINNKDLITSDSQIGIEVEVTSSKVSGCGMHENQNDMVLVENIHVNKINVLDGKMRHGNEPYVSSPALMIRRKFQKAKPNLGRAHSKKGKPDIGKGTAGQSEASKPEDNLLQQGDSDTQLLLKEKVEFLSSLEVSARNDCIGSSESDLASKHAELQDVGPLGRIGEKTVGDNCMTSVTEEQYLNKPTSRPQLLRGSNSSKIASDQRTISNASECEIDHSEKRMHRKIKPNVTKGRGSKRIRSKTTKKEPRASKATLVTLRASQEEDEDDAEDFESDYEEESYHLAPEEVNKAPVFVPIGLRSPEPVPAQIEETMEELEITVNVPDIGCMAVVEHPLSNTVVTTQEMKQGENLNITSFEMTTGEYTQDEPGANDGSTEAAITLLTMGDLLLQSEITTVQGDVGVCVLPHVHSEDKNHIPFSPDSVHHEILHECQEVSLPVISTFPASFEENKIISEEQSAREERGFMEKLKENATATRNTASKITNNLRMRGRFAKPKPNLEKILGTNRFDAHEEVPSLCITKGEEPEPQRDTEKNASKTTELEDKSLGPVITAENKEQSKLACVHDIKGTSISQEVNLPKRNEDQEVESQEVQILSVAPVVSSETGPHTLALGMVLAESSVEEPLRKDSEGDSVPECSPTSLPEVQPENIINPLDLTANLIPNVHQDGEDEQTFILTLVEIPANAVEDFTDTAAQLMPNPLLPAPILVKSVNTKERGDMRKRFHCRLDESDDAPPDKKTSPTSRNDCQEYTSEVCSNELINIFEERGEPYKGQSIFPTSGNTHTTPEPQNKQVESSFQSVKSRSLDKIIDTHIEKNMPHLPQDEMIMSDKEERTNAASKTEQKDNRIPSSKAPLSRPGRRPLGFLSLICSKSSLESDEPTQVHSKKRLKPLIPVSRQKLKRSNPFSESQKKNQESSDLLPSPSVINNPSENTGSSATQVSSGQPSLKETCKSGQKRRRDEEPTTVSEYFFSDIFIEVDEKE